MSLKGALPLNIFILKSIHIGKKKVPKHSKILLKKIAELAILTIFACFIHFTAYLVFFEPFSCAKISQLKL